MLSVRIDFETQGTKSLTKFLIWKKGDEVSDNKNCTVQFYLSMLGRNWNLTYSSISTFIDLKLPLRWILDAICLSYLSWRMGRYVASSQNQRFANKLVGIRYLAGRLTPDERVDVQTRTRKTPCLKEPSMMSRSSYVRPKKLQSCVKCIFIWLR